jgi:hypothetical protein
VQSRIIFIGRDASQEQRDPLRVVGGVHAGTSPLTQLAEFSQERAGYFYDEKFRQEVDRKLNKHKEGLLAAKEHTKLKDIPGFDYNPEQQERKEEETEINLPCKRTEVVLTVIAGRVEEATSTLRTLFGGTGGADDEMP